MGIRGPRMTGALVVVLPGSCVPVEMPPESCARRETALVV